MELTGKWIIEAVCVMNEQDEREWINAAEYLARNPSEARNPLYSGFMYLDLEEKVLKTLMPIPENVSDEDIEAAVAAGQAKVMGRALIRNENALKTEDGKLMMNLSSDPSAEMWSELKEEGEKLIMSGMMRLAKI